MSTTVIPQGVEQQVNPTPRGELGPTDLSRIAQDLQIRRVQVEAVVQLLGEGNTIPFITRYRKERTGGLDEEILRTIAERVENLRALADRKQTILRTIESQGKLTDELRHSILAADNPKRLEDLYLPYKPKKRSLAQAARDKGLENLALAIWTADPVVANLAEVLPTLINPEQGLTNEEDIKAGAGHIIAELIAECADIRGVMRAVVWDTGKLVTSRNEELAEGQGLEYKDYFEFSEPIRQIPPHRILAINRGEKANVLRVKLDWDSATGRRVMLERLPFPTKKEPAPEAEVPPPAEGAPPRPRERGFVNRYEELLQHPHREFIELVADDALSRLLFPSLEREVRRELTSRAESHGVSVFARNLRSKLMASPLQGKRVLAIDPAYKSGCKLAVLSETGELLSEGVVYPHQPQNRKAEAKARLEELVRRHQVSVVAIGNGTGCRETEELVSDLIAELEFRRQNPGAALPAPAQAETPPPLPLPAAEPQLEIADAPPAPEAIAPPPLDASAPIPETPPPIPAEPLPEALPELAYVIVNEAGASVYSASPIGREEFPHLDATLRGTISIGRRLQDPLSELVKIDPQHVGVGLYQHDMSSKHLRESLEGVIESCVNTVGVDLNTASVPLLRHVSGLNALVARDLVEFRRANGPFRRREQLMEVNGIGEMRFIQAAGFLKILGGDEPLDSTWIHPESYHVARQLLAEMGFGPEALREREKLTELNQKLQSITPEEVAARLQVGVPTVKDIIEALAKPGRDPREDLPPPVFKKGILKLEDLQQGMELKGTVLNVVDFGAFVDIGLKDSGLVHISQMANRYVKSPYDVVAVGDVVQVWVLSVDGQRDRVKLTMISPGTERKPPERPARPPRREPRPNPHLDIAIPGQPRAERPPRPARPPQEETPREGAPREGAAPRGEGRPQGRGQGGGRGPGGGRGQGGQRPGQRVGLPPRGTTRLGGGAQKRGDKPQEQGQAPVPAEQGAEGQAPTPAKQPTPQRKQKRGASVNLTPGALAGRESLSTFGELAAFFQARTQPPEPPAPPPPAQAEQPAPEQTPPPPPAEEPPSTT